jgi:hypothetical protein
MLSFSRYPERFLSNAYHSSVGINATWGFNLSYSLHLIKSVSSYTSNLKRKDNFNFIFTFTIKRLLHFDLLCLPSQVMVQCKYTRVEFVFLIVTELHNWALCGGLVAEELCYNCKVADSSLDKVIVFLIYLILPAVPYPRGLLSL